MSRYICALFLVLSIARPICSAPADEIKETLARAEALYYEADFTKSIELLLRVDDMLRSQSDHLKERVDVKLQLALAHLGLNDSPKAKVYFSELYALDPEYVIDAQTFSPKVVQLAQQAKTEQYEIRCRTALKDAEREVGLGNAEAARAAIAVNKTKCPGLSDVAPAAAELFYKQGVEQFRRAQVPAALQKFRIALQLDPNHELAAQYVELTNSKLQVDADRLLVAWHKDFAAGEFGLAATEYRDLVAVSSAETINDVRAEYRRALTRLVEAWNIACKNYDAAAMEDIRVRTNKLLPDTSIGEDILAKMTSCTPSGCLQMGADLALARLKNRVDPVFLPQILAQLKSAPMTVRIKARIDERGDVVASEPLGANPMVYSSVRAAFEQWKFSPVLFQGEARCVDTEIPIVIKVRGSN